MVDGGLGDVYVSHSSFRACSCVGSALRERAFFISGGAFLSSPDLSVLPDFSSSIKSLTDCEVCKLLIAARGRGGGRPDLAVSRPAPAPSPRPATLTAGGLRPRP